VSERFYNDPDPSLPGWHVWGPRDDTVFNALIGHIHIRAVSETSAEVRLDPHERLASVMGSLHGGALLGFCDIALFGGSAALGACEAGNSVTVELNAHFLSPGKLGVPIIAEFEVVRSTRRLVFARGLMRQDGEALLQYSAIIRKGSTGA
jgi:uncharacterized protein (TIGR00369 family)